MIAGHPETALLDVIRLRYLLQNAPADVLQFLIERAKTRTREHVLRMQAAAAQTNGSAISRETGPEGCDFVRIELVRWPIRRVLGRSPRWRCERRECQVSPAEPITDQIAAIFE